MTPLEIAEVISLALTPITIYLACLVAGLWWGAFLQATRANGSKTPHQWFILGVVISFIGQAGDNFYWGIAWTCEALGLRVAEDWFEYGVLSNIPFRQIAGAAGAYCHLRAWAGVNSTSHIWLDKSLKWSIAVGIWVAALLILASKIWVFS